MKGCDNLNQYLQPRKKITLRTKIYLFVIMFGVINIFSPLVAHADIFGFEVQDIYATITENVKETNEILQKAFAFSQISPYDVVNSIDGTSSGAIAIAVRTASKTAALVVATLLLMVDFFKKTINFEWSSKWENILIFLIKIIVIKQVVQNADVIVSYLYAGFKSINDAATNTSIDFLPYGTPETYTWIDEDGVITKFVKKGWWDFWYDAGAGQYRTTYTYSISKDAVRIFFPNATFGSTDLNADPLSLPNPKTTLFMPTLEVILLQPYFLVMKAIAYIIFVIVIGRVFELAIYTIFAPLPLATFASETTHDIARNFIKNYIATVLQIAVIVVMFLVYAALAKYISSLYPQTTMLQIIVLISLGLGVVKSGSWSKKICGIG